MYPLSKESRECNFVKTLIGHMDEHDVNGFSKTVEDYDLISRQHPWFDTILLRIENQMDEDME